MAGTSPAGDQGAKKPDVRTYLEEKVFPILTSGLEELLRAVEQREKKLHDSEEEDIPEIQPLFFLARYLMRNASQTGESNPQPGLRQSSARRVGPKQRDEAPPADANLESPTDT
jgi:hypothetical protein